MDGVGVLISICTLLYIGWINNRSYCIYSAGNYIPYLVITIMKKNILKECVWLCVCIYN